MERLTKALESNGLFGVDDFQIQHDHTIVILLETYGLQ
jgi:hypothetical protein